MKKLLLTMTALVMLASTSVMAQSFAEFSLLANDVESIYKGTGVGVTNLESKWLMPTNWLTIGAITHYGSTNQATCWYSNRADKLKYYITSTNITVSQWGSTTPTTNYVTTYDYRNQTNGYIVVFNSIKNLFKDAPLWAPRDAAQVQGISYPPVGTTNVFFNLVVRYRPTGSTNESNLNFYLTSVPDGVNEPSDGPIYNATFKVPGVQWATNQTMSVTQSKPIPAYLFNNNKAIRLQAFNCTAVSTTNDAIQLLEAKIVGFMP